MRKKKVSPRRSKPSARRPKAEKSVLQAASAAWYPVISEKSLYRLESPNEISVISLWDNSIYKLSNLAAYIWVQLDGTRTLGEILKRSETEFELSPKMTKQISDFVGALEKTKLIERSNQKKPRKNLKKSEIKISLQKKNLLPPVLEQRDKLSALYLLSAGSSN